MKQLLTLATFLAAAVTAPATEEKRLKWEQIEPYVRGRQVKVHLKTGETAPGWSKTLSYASITVAREDGSAERSIGADEVERITVLRARASQRQALRRSVGRGFRTSLGKVATPWGPFALAGAGITGGYYLAALPFCAVGDLATAGAAEQVAYEIRILPRVK